MTCLLSRTASARACEARVRGLAVEAESRTMASTAGQIDDYLRIKRGDQWMAFDGAESREDDRLTVAERVLLTIAAQAEERP